jgi:protein SCO1
MERTMEPKQSVVGGLSNTKKALLAAIVLALAALGLAEATLWWAPSQQVASLIGGPFRLEGPDGQIVTDADMKGSPFLVFFGYTHCPDVCPTALARLSDVLKRLPDKKIKALFISFDPERDTPATLKDYVSSFDPRVIGLTGDYAAVEQAEKAYRVYAKKVVAADGDYSFDHSSIVYLMDAKGLFVEAFNLERSPKEAAEELAGYL